MIKHTSAVAEEKLLTYSCQRLKLMLLFRKCQANTILMLVNKILTKITTLLIKVYFIQTAQTSTHLGPDGGQN